MSTSHGQYLKAIKPYIEKTAKTCSYCDYLSDLVLLEWKYMYITIAIGQYMEWYVQICPKAHKTSVAGLGAEEAEEYENMKHILKKTYRDVYNTNGIAFEHGQAGSCHWGDDFDKNQKSLCHHAHLHLIPCEVNIRDEIRTILPWEIIIHNHFELRYVREEVLVNDSYLYFEDMNNIGYIYPVEDENIIPRQFLRRCVAHKLWIEERADWVNYPWIDFFAPTKQRLQSLLKTYYDNLTTYD